jgi:hypothetical protein
MSEANGIGNDVPGETNGEEDDIVGPGIEGADLFDDLGLARGRDQAEWPR